jgi:uncharacterized protein YccT (UPF0319 family)
MDSVKRNFDVKTMSHVELLFRLWKCMNLPNEPEIVSSEWLIIGFQASRQQLNFGIKKLCVEQGSFDRLSIHGNLSFDNPRVLC